MPDQMILPDGPQITRRILNRERARVYRTISRYVLNNCEYQVVEDELSGMLVELVSEVLTERVVSESHTVGLDVPTSAWQFFKADYGHKWWLRWLVKRRPVKRNKWSKTVRFDSKRLYPNADIPMEPSPLGRPIIYETINETSWTQG